MAEEEKRISVRIPKSLHRKVKTKAALLDKSVSDVLREYLRAWVADLPPKLEQEGEQP